MILLKPHVSEKSGSRIEYKNALGQSDCRIFKAIRNQKISDCNVWKYFSWNEVINRNFGNTFEDQLEPGSEMYLESSQKSLIEFFCENS